MLHNGYFRQYRRLEEREFIVAGADCAAGGPDRCCCQFLSKTNLDVPMIYHAPILATEMTNAIAPVLESIYDQTKVKPVIGYERNNGGVFEMERLAAMNRSGKFDIFKMPAVGKTQNDAAARLGWDTTSKTRPDMLMEIKQAVDEKVLRIYDKITIEEMFSFIVCKTSSSWKAQAEKNAHDDTVMALAIAWQIYLNSPSTKDILKSFERPKRYMPRDMNPMTI